MLDPNNARNRWRRYREAREAYGFCWMPFREWVQVARPQSYAAEPHHRNFSVAIGRHLADLHWR